MDSVEHYQVLAPEPVGFGRKLPETDSITNQKESQADSVDVREESWLAVAGWPYEVSDIGRVRRSEPGPSTRVGRVLRGATYGGYHSVLLRPGQPHQPSKMFRVHALVAAAFIGPRPSRYTINHKNGVKTDNRAVNLEYVTHRQNVRHAVDMGLYGCPPVARDAAHALGRSGLFTAPEIAAMLGIGEGHIAATVPQGRPSVWFRDYRYHRFIWRVFGEGKKLGRRNKY